MKKSKTKIVREHEPHPVLLRKVKSLMHRSHGQKNQQPARVAVCSRFIWDHELT